MRRLFLVILLSVLGCRTCVVDVSPRIEAEVAAVAPVRLAPDAVPATSRAPSFPGTLDLPTLWNLALANNPALREAAGDLEASRGRLIQAGKYPNPRFLYEHEELGTTDAPGGTFRLQLNQEIVTAGKRRLDRAIATRGTDVATLALLGRKYDVLTRIRRAYYEYLGWEYTTRVHAENVAALQKGVAITRKNVEKGGIAPRVDLLRLEASLNEARINQDRSRINAETAWRRLAAEVGSPDLPLPGAAGGFPETIPEWKLKTLEQRVLAVSTELRQASLEAERSRLEVERARAEAVPNVQVGGGYSRSFLERAQGAVVSVETAVPLWDRKQGQIHETEARWARAQAAQRSTANRLLQDIAEAFARYEGTRQQVQRLTTQVLPRLAESLEDLLQRYQGGAAQVFLDVLVAEQSLNETRIRLADARRELWRAVADLQGLMQLDLDEELTAAEGHGP
jgi:cobalt-zinc-cadmium efflux system outer membrane protein